MISKETARYTPYAPGKRQCADCSMFRNNHCTLVRGQINPQGWCKHWTAKDGEKKG